MTVDAQAEVRAIRTSLRQGQRAMRELVWTEANINPEALLDSLAARLEAAEAAEAALRTEFFRLLPYLDYESEDGVWAWEQHPWFSLLSVEYDDCVAALAAGRGEHG